MTLENLSKAFSYNDYISYLNEIGIDYTFIGKTLCGKNIPTVKVGSGEKSFVYVGVHHAAERITGAVLLAFIADAVKLAAFFDCSLYIIPFLNIDGAEIQSGNTCLGDIFYKERLKMNSDSTDFSLWQANARGVDLNHNYDAGFEEYKNKEAELGIFGGCRSKYSGEYPASEPETEAMVKFIDKTAPRAVITLHSQGEEIYFTSAGKFPNGADNAAVQMSKLCGYKISIPEGTAAYGGLTDFLIEKRNIPSFTVECGLGQNPLPASDLADIYKRLKSLLFNFIKMW